jgi:hypothetical protein
LLIVVYAFDHCIVCTSTIYGFWLPLWYLQTFLRQSHFHNRCYFHGPNNDIQNITQKTKDGATRAPLKTGGELRYSGRVAVPAPHVAPVVLLYGFWYLQTFLILRIGENRYFSSLMEVSRCGMKINKILCIIIEPNRIGTRQFDIEKTSWKYISYFDGSYIWSRNCLPFWRTWIHPSVQ